MTGASDNTKSVPTGTGGGPWLSISQLARARGVTRQSLHERVSRLAAEGKIEVRQGRGRERLVDLTQYDRTAGQTTDLARAQAQATRRHRSELDFAASQAKRAAAEAELKVLDLRQRRGELVEVREVHEVAIQCGHAMVSAIEGIVTRAEDVITAATTGGPAGVRRVLREIARDLRKQASLEFTRLGELEGWRDDDGRV